MSSRREPHLRFCLEDWIIIGRNDCHVLKEHLQKSGVLVAWGGGWGCLLSHQELLEFSCVTCFLCRCFVNKALISKIYFIILMVCIWEHVYMWMQMPLEARGIRYPRAGVIDCCVQFHMGAGNWPRVLFLEKQSMPINTKLFLQCFTAFLSNKRRKNGWCGYCPGPLCMRKVLEILPALLLSFSLSRSAHWEVHLMLNCLVSSSDLFSWKTGNQEVWKVGAYLGLWLGSDHQRQNSQIRSGCMHFCLVLIYNCCLVSVTF